MTAIGNIRLPDFPLLLAPMEDVSDPPFRAVCKTGGADLVYTEFVSSRGLLRGTAGSQRKLDVFDEERPVGIQLFGGDENSLSQASSIVEAIHPDLLDINFGCPVKGIVNQWRRRGGIERCRPDDPSDGCLCEGHASTRHRKDPPGLGRADKEYRRGRRKIAGCGDQSPDDPWTHTLSTLQRRGGLDADR